MSNDKKKALLNEQTTKRFWKLAGLKPIHEKAYMFEEDEDLEEGMDRAKEDDDKDVKEEVEEIEETEEVDEMGMAPPMADEDEPEPEMDMGDEGPEDGQDVEVDVPEGDVASLKTARDILDQILSAVDGGGDEDEPEMGLGDEDALEEDFDDDLNEVDQEELEEVAERIAARVAKRIQESFINKSNKSKK